MSDDAPLNCSDTLLRYASSTRCLEGKALPAAFDLRPNEDGLSANSIELCNAGSEQEAIDQIVKTVDEKRKLSKNGLFFHLPVGCTKATLLACPVIDDAQMVADPVEYVCRHTCEKKMDNSHALVKGLQGNELVARELLVECVSGTTAVPS